MNSNSSSGSARAELVQLLEKVRLLRWRVMAHIATLDQLQAGLIDLAGQQPARLVEGEDSGA